MSREFSDDPVKLRMMAAQMRHNARMARDGVYRAKFESAADELERKAEEAAAGPDGKKRPTG